MRIVCTVPSVSVHVGLAAIVDDDCRNWLTQQLVHLTKKTLEFRRDKEMDRLVRIHMSHMLNQHTGCDVLELAEPFQVLQTLS